MQFCLNGYISENVLFSFKLVKQDVLFAKVHISQLGVKFKKDDSKFLIIPNYIGAAYI